MPRAALTDLMVQKLKSDKQVTYYDTSLPSFGVLIGKKRKTWLVMKGKERKRTVLGHYPSMTLAEARRRAHEHLDTHQRQDAEPLPFPDALESFRSLYLPTIAASTAKEWERLLRKHFSSLGDLQKLTARDVYRITETLKPSEANHAIVVLRRMLNWCNDTGRISNTFKLKKPHKERSRERVLSLDELARVWKASEHLGTFGDIVKLLILTGQRRGEIANIHLCTLKDSDVEIAAHLTQQNTKHKSAIANNTITWHAQHTKNRKEHTIPLTAHAATLATKVKNATTNYNTWSKPKAALDKLSGVSNWTLHDLRRSCASQWAAMAVMPHVIERILNHTQKGVAGIYNRHKYLEEMRDALERWQALMLSLEVSKDSTP
jgi:integrase